jgi:hypothetical protein
MISKFPKKKKKKNDITKTKKTRRARKTERWYLSSYTPGVSINVVKEYDRGLVGGRISPSSYKKRGSQEDWGSREEIQAGGGSTVIQKAVSQPGAHCPLSRLINMQRFVRCIVGFEREMGKKKKRRRYTEGIGIERKKGSLEIMYWSWIVRRIYIPPRRRSNLEPCIRMDVE